MIVSLGIFGKLQVLGNLSQNVKEHDVIHDFIEKLKKNTKKLRILGDGTQSKSYLYITACIDVHLPPLRETT